MRMQKEAQEDNSLTINQMALRRKSPNWESRRPHAAANVQMIYPLSSLFRPPRCQVISACGYAAETGGGYSCAPDTAAGGAERLQQERRGYK